MGVWLYGERFFAERSLMCGVQPLYSYNVSSIMRKGCGASKVEVNAK